MTAATWQGRYGAVLLGPTQDRVARYLADLTRHGWVHLRTEDIAQRLGLERSETYRILARLRALGLFGVSNDRGGHGGGRRIWRTERPHDGRGLDGDRHRLACARIRGAAAAVRAAAAARLGQLRAALVEQRGPQQAPRDVPPAAPAPTFADRMRAAGLGPLMAEWGVTT